MQDAGFKLASPAHLFFYRDIDEDFLAIGVALVEGVATAVETHLLRHGHEDGVVLLLPQIFGLDDLLGLALEEKQAGEDVDVGFDDEGLHR